MRNARSDGGSVYFYRFGPFTAGAAKMIFIVLFCFFNNNKPLLMWHNNESCGGENGNCNSKLQFAL